MKTLFLTLFIIALLLLVAIHLIFPPIAATALLKPIKTTPTDKPEDAIAVSLTTGSITLSGWHFKTKKPPKGTIVYLHGVGDSKFSSIGVAEHFCPIGFDVISYDSRAHGDSEGEYCTYGFHEKEDLKLILKEIKQEPIFLIGASMGAAIGIQAAPDSPNVNGIITFDIFSDLKSVASDRLPRIVPNYLIQSAFRKAEEMAKFKADKVSPVKYAKKLTTPALIIHGQDDIATRPIHSERVFNALKGNKELLLIKNAGHCQAASKPETWEKVKSWVIKH